jgi:hypothetical protein
MLNSPGDRAPRGSEEEDVDANKSDGRLLSILIVDNNIPKVILAGGRSS